ncbi:MFS transporter [Enemella evansiae]|uniref:MFS transporter n=1 Tax=Enemella evansiae TaxID=2016499 RepID=A0A255G5T6_9ACTN|nr:MFS transporter [Enemella evansiae]OYO00409.1 MFS transporter [Enemella evansiae]OYO02801.1 MFS transporter [Enemella evansiae]OYO05621.1 MFS transporter [Enemella evansiae]OYO09573.1 MFS transporter [Enemella evansiae]OYO15188.1 MFS transporter [Enemella evansiae]
MADVRNTGGRLEAGATRQLDESEARKVTWGALVGTAMEWYDFFLFNTAAALVFNKQYFTGGPAAATMASFATLGVGFAARPIGGLIFGWLGDRIGRRSVLLTTIVGIGIFTGVIGLLPNFASIGVWAPIALVILRVLQGLFVGGEWSGAMTIAVENAPLAKRARYAAMPQIGSPIGTILSSGGFFLVSYLLGPQTFDAWGWRIPFLAAIPLLLVALWIRAKLEESPVFRELEETGGLEKSPLLAVLRQSWLQILIGSAVAFLGVGGFYLVTTFVVSYGTNTLGMSKNLLLLGTIIAAAVEIGVLVSGGRLGERFGASKVVIWGAVASIVLAVPSFLMVVSKQPVLVVLGMTIAVAALSYPYAASGTVMTGLFPAATRYSGAAMSQNLAGVVSGFVPFMATAWVAAADRHWWPAAVLLAAISLITLIGGVVAPRNSVDLPGFKH